MIKGFVAATLLCATVFAQDAPMEPDGRPVSWIRMAPNLASDQKRMWLAPARMASGGRWLAAAGVLSATAALIATDTRTASYFRRTDAFHGFNSAFSGKSTVVGIAAAPVLLYAAGIIRRDGHARNTALLAGEAVAGAEILTTVLKDIDRRRRPAEYAPGADFGGSWFHAKGSWVRGIGSFPSGHAIAAFAVATVISRRYPRRRWVPYVAYGLAGVVGFSRITLNSHYPSDVFMGAALGYSISRFVVLRQ
jgi:membrane-associated phospholipid phosphatase